MVDEHGNVKAVLPHKAPEPTKEEKKNTITVTKSVPGGPAEVHKVTIPHEL